MKSKQVLTTGILMSSLLFSIGGNISYANSADMDESVKPQVEATQNLKNKGSIEIRYFNPSLKFEAKSDSIKYNNGSVDFKNDLGIDSKSTPEIRWNVNNNLRFDFLKINNDGHATLSEELEYEGNTYNAGVNVASKLNMTYVRATWLRPITKSEKMETNWMIDLKGFKFDTAVSGMTSTGDYIKTSKSFTGAIPTIGFGINSKLDANGKVLVNAELSGLPLGKYGKFYDFEAGLKILPSENMCVNVGYRAFDIDVKNPDKDENAQYKLSGPYFGLEYKF